MPLGAKFDEAFLLAHSLHHSQLRKGTTIPYMTHLMAVASLVGENGGNEEQIIAALLHDVLEDQGHKITVEELCERFGETVAEIVVACSDAQDSPKPPWQERKESYLAHLKTASPTVKLVSAADKLHNARAIVTDLRRGGSSVWQRFQGGKEGTLWYYQAVVHALEAGWNHPIVADVARTVAEMEMIITSKVK